jgi:4'-phosphopantetheinyl transferase EntD
MTAAVLPNPAALMSRDAVAVVAADHHGGEPLLPDEARWLAGRTLHPQREAEFRAGRACARQALAQLGYHNWPLLPAPTREPQWPPGVVGSITHSGTYCAAAVASERVCAGLGIDVEAIDRIREDMAELICSSREPHRPDRPGTDARTTLALLFSAKESVFKAVFPRTHIPFEPADIEIACDAGAGTFRAHAAALPALDRICTRIEGRYAFASGYVLTTAWMEPEPPASVESRE